VAPEGQGQGPPGRVRLGDADRDRLAQLLGRHYAEGRLDAEELSRRLEVVLSAAGREEAAAALSDLPALEAPAGGRRWPGRRHGESGKPQAAWVPTSERFRDPTTRRVMRVWVDPGDASRHYVAEAGT
jgi:hypothetical protein